MSDSERVPRFTRGDRMAKARRDAGISTGEMARFLDVSPATIGNYEHDRTAPMLGTLRSWAARTDVALEWLRGGAEPPKDDAPGEDLALAAVDREPPIMFVREIAA
jgi:transcriptional regulator with XRE-family HTH domain